MLIQCPECREQISDQAAACPRCGRPISDQDRESARSAAATAAKTSKCLKIGVVTFAVAIGVFTLLMALRARSRPPQPEPAQLAAGWPITGHATPTRELGVEAWMKFVAADPRTRGMVQRIEVDLRGEADTMVAYVWVKPDSAFAKTAARHPHAELVEQTAKLLSDSLWKQCRDDPLFSVDVYIGVGERRIGRAFTGYTIEDHDGTWRFPFITKWSPEGGKFPPSD